MPYMERRVTFRPFARPVLLQVPKAPVGIEDNGPVRLGEVLEPDLTPHPLVRGPPAAQRATVPGRALVYREVRVLAGPLQVI